MIEAGVLKGLAGKSETLRMALVHQERALAAQTQQVAACNALHELEERLSRWLLQSRDLLQIDTLPSNAGVLVTDVGSAAQQRDPCGPQIAGASGLSVIGAATST